MKTDECNGSLKREDIIEFIVASKIVEKLANRFSSILGSNKEDYIQEMYLMILTIPEAKLASLYAKNELVYYIISIARNQAVYKKSDFNRLYNNPLIEVVEQIQENPNEQQD